MALTYGLGDIVTLKKPHACGENRWCIIRMGMDIRVKCTKCDHSVLIPRQRFDRILRKVLIPAERTLVSQEEEND
ncbi:DUF951 domain-containing protein [Alicyclobacillus mengziensis]|uniref:DUF951 domain-containing protein n=1 Tax=Alicyclobacillus mengziensis TaxID=2931921 RepID=UPI00201252B6|nr:DUF951 domain-containing protein [Alicyclobacillus mengziensis]